ncbi:MAG: hypothetical protein H6Q00_595 [Holophagaceae bacterium]|nr:hypothetical protein [Holophagaceae bacterium]
MNSLQLILLLIGTVLVLWVAYKIGQVILRLALGLAALGLIAYGIWYFFVR